ncbi:MAG: DUF721 domain-containing protein [Acidobacteriota bacterium]
MQTAASFVKKLKLPAGSDNPENRAKAAWKRAAGIKIEKYTLAASLVRGTLVIEVSDHIWQKQLYALRKHLLHNLAEILGEPLVTDLDFRPMPPRRKPMREEVAARTAESIGDPVLSMLYQQSKKRQA